MGDNKSGVDCLAIRWRRVMKAEIKGTKKSFVGDSWGGEEAYARPQLPEQWVISRRIQHQMTSKVRGGSTNCSHSLGCLLWCFVELGNCGVLWTTSFWRNVLSLTRLWRSAFPWPGSIHKKIVCGWEICVCATSSRFSALSSDNPCLTSPCWY